MECCKRPPKMPSKTGVSRAEIAAHAFECSIGSRGASEQFKAHDGKCYPDCRCWPSISHCSLTDNFSGAPLLALAPSFEKQAVCLPCEAQTSARSFRKP